MQQNDHRSRGSQLHTPGERSWEPPIFTYSPQEFRWNGPTLVVAPLGYLWSTTWSSPTFDLRPDLASRVGNVKVGQPMDDTASRLYVLLTGPGATTFDSTNLTVEATEYVQVFDANPQPGAGAAPGSAVAPTLVPLAPYDVSSNFASGNNTSLVGFAPPGTALGGGEGYPIRYWRLVLNFRFFQPQEEPLPIAVEPSRLVLTAGAY